MRRRCSNGSWPSGSCGPGPSSASSPPAPWATTTSKSTPAKIAPQCARCCAACGSSSRRGPAGRTCASPTTSPPRTAAHATEERNDVAALVAERFRGIRPAPGYPACPDHTEKLTLFDLLDVPNTAGITLTESCAMLPAASVSGWYFAHPEARYCGLGRIGKDQVLDYAARKGMAPEEVERWLGANLAYTP